MVIFIENLLREPQVHRLRGGALPRQRHQPIQPRARHAVLRRRRRDLLQAAQLAQRLLEHLVGQLRGVDLGAQLLDFPCICVGVAQLLLDGLELLAQEVVALRTGDLLLHVVLDLGLELEVLPLLDQLLAQELHALAHIEHLQQVLALHGGQRRQRRGDEIRQRAGLLDAGQHGQDVVREVGGAQHDFRKQIPKVARQGEVHLVRLRRDDVRERLDVHAQVRLALQDRPDLHAPDALGEQHEAARLPAGHGDDLEHARQAADFIEVDLLFAGRRFIAHRDHGGELERAARLLDEAHGARVVDLERPHRMREQHRVLERQHRNITHVRQILVL